MPQASGASARVAYVEESTWGTTPGSPSMRLLKAALPGVSLAPNVASLVSNALNAARSVENARGGDITVAGAVPFELPLLGIGTILKHAIGPCTTGLRVVQGSGLTGLTAKQAESGSANGAGTLSLSGSNATWAENGDTAGAGVNVSAEGYYTLLSNNGQHLIVYSAGSPSGTSATVTVSTSNYCHIIKRGALPVGLSMEIGYADLAKYQVLTGCRVNQATITIPDTGLITGTLDMIGKSAAALTGTPLDASLTDTTHVPFAEFDGTFLENGAAIATVVNLTMQIANNLQPQPVAGSRYIGGLQEGKGGLTGQLALLFEDETYLNKVLNETASSIKVTFTASNGTIEIEIPNLKYFGPAGIGIPTDQGLIQTLDYVALYDSIEATDIKVTITNTEATL